MTYRTPESLIRQIMSEGHAPALKVPEPERVKDALEVLAKNGITSAAKQDENTITVNAKEMNTAFNILDNAVQKGLIQAKPQVVSAEAVPVPDHRPEPVTPTHEPHPPHGGMTFGEEKKEEECCDTEQNKGSIDAQGKVALEPRSLNNRMQNQIKKIDEEEQIDEVSKKTLSNYSTKAAWSLVGHAKGEVEHDKAFSDAALDDNVDAADHHHDEKEKHARKFANRVHGIKQAQSQIAGVKTRQKYKSRRVDEEVLNELSYSTLKKYTKAGTEALKSGSSADKLDKKIARRAAMIDVAKKKKVAKVQKAAFSENIDPINTVLEARRRLISEGGSLRLKATINSECGKHTAKIYKDHEWGEHRVKFFVNGKHHEPADYHTTDYHDAHGTAHTQLAHLSKYNGANHVKESADANRPFLSEALVKCGTYHTQSGDTVTMHRHPSDPKHHFLVSKGKVTDSHHGSAEDFHKKITSGPHGLKGALHEGMINELSRDTLANYVKKSSKSMSDLTHRAVVHDKKAKEAHKRKDAHRQWRIQAGEVSRLGKKWQNRFDGVKLAADKLAKEEVELTEGKKDDVEKAKKHLFKHPEADAIGRSIHTAVRHHNYVQDACDHVYSNHCKELSYEDYDKIKPHLENEFKAHGLK